MTECPVVFKMNGHYQQDINTKSTRIKACHVIRDPRDIIVSGFFSHKWSHPIASEADQAYRNWLNSVSDEEGLLFEVTHGGYRPAQGLLGRSVMQDLDEWNYHDDRVVELQMENLVNNPFRLFKNILQHLEIEIDEQRLNEAIEMNSFENLSGGRKRGIENNKEHYRKGISGSWRDHFTDQHESVFEEKWGTLLDKLGYRERA
jgi:hypothetical protein